LYVKGHNYALKLVHTGLLNTIRSYLNQINVIFVSIYRKKAKNLCVSTCPMRAIEFGPIEELRKKYGRLSKTKGMPIDTITHPNLVITPHKDASLSRS
jgi:Fe-S-cluster-containing dehydrogenase component